METTKYEIELDTNGDEFDWEDAHAALREWADTAGVDYFTVEGKAMGWTRADGFTVIAWDILADAFSLNGDYRVVFTLADGENTLTAVRYSHDEPVGASFAVRPATEQEIEDYA